MIKMLKISAFYLSIFVPNAMKLCNFCDMMFDVSNYLYVVEPITVKYTRLKNAIITDAVRNLANFLFQQDLKHTIKALDWLLGRILHLLKLDPKPDQY